MSALFLSIAHAPINHENGIPPWMLPGGQVCPGCEPEVVRDFAAQE